MRLRFHGEHTPLFPTMVVQGDVDTDEEPSDQDGIHPTSGDQEDEQHQPSPSHDQEVQVSQPESSHHVPDETSLGSLNVVLDRATTTLITSGGVEDRGNIIKTLSKLSDAPLLEGNTSRSVEGSDRLN